jgi:hypothetical protein
MPKLYQTKDGFNLVTSDKRLYFIFETSKGFCSQLKGIVSDNFKGGRLVKSIPDKLKTTFFKLNKQQ